MEIRTDLFLGDSKKILKKFPDNSVDLIVTSPPYADQRKGTYGGIQPDKYVEWLPVAFPARCPCKDRAQLSPSERHW